MKPLSKIRNIVCSICLYGDGLWRERNDARSTINIPEGLPLCEKCKADGWIDDPKEVQKAILEDPVLSKIVNHQSPYENI